MDLYTNAEKTGLSRGNWCKMGFFHCFRLTVIILHLKKNFLLGVAIWWLEKTINFLKNIGTRWNNGDRSIEKRLMPEKSGQNGQINELIPI